MWGRVGTTAGLALAAWIGAHAAVWAQEAPDTAASDIQAAEAKRADPQGAQMTAAFRAWAKRWNVTNASFVAMRNKQVIGQAWMGDRRSGTPVQIASLSKAITGVCVAKLVEARKLTYGAKIGTLLPAYFRTRKPADARARSITVGQLLTHTSGMTYDPTQGDTLQQFNFKTKSLALQLAAALRQRLGAAPGTGYAYNNVNYAALGLIIETVTRKPYERYCAETVLEPAGVDNARLDPNWTVMSSYGGWRMSPVDYALFLDHFRPASRLMKSRPAAWPKYAFAGSGASYGIGALLRPSGTSYNFWHAGDWRWRDAERSADFGAYFAMWKQNVRFVATYAPLPPSGAVSDLDQQMFLAANP